MTSASIFAGLRPAQCSLADCLSPEDKSIRCVYEAKISHLVRATRKIFFANRRRWTAVRQQRMNKFKSALRSAEEHPTLRCNSSTSNPLQPYCAQQFGMSRDG